MTITETTTITTPTATIDQDRVIATLTAAFSTDPVIRWIFPDAGAYLRTFPELTRLVGGDAFTAGTAAIAPGTAGAALWLSPDAPSDDAALATLFASSVDGSRAEEVFALLTQMGEHHPIEPVWYLPFVGVDPPRQGKGLGAGLVRAGLARADADGLPAYLEASTLRNRALYERLGFQVIGEIRVHDSPPLWPMLRPTGAAR